MATIEERIECIRNDRDHGSRWLVRETLSLLYDLASDASEAPNARMQLFHKVANELAQARPAMAAMAGAVGRVLSAPDELSALAAEAAHLLEEYEHATERISVYARSLITGTLMTLSLSGTVLDVLVACQAQIERVFVLEGRPRYEGREMARSLAAHGIPVTLITDAQADIFLPRCQMVVVGADTILETGDVFNKAGTALLAWAAQGHKLPFYVICETLKIAPRQWTANLTQLEEKEPEEVLEQPIQGVEVHNYYFDRTPSSLITNIITEQGILTQQEIRRIATTLKRLNLQTG